MSMAKGRQLFTNRSTGPASIRQLASKKDYAELAKRGPMGRGTLKAMAGKGDREAAAMLTKMGDPAPDPNEPGAEQ